MTRTGTGIPRGLYAASILFVASSAASAGGPTGGTVVVGSATITNPNSNQTVVDQSSNKALINWYGFSIPAGSSVVFEQPNTGSLTVNRVTGPNASAIDGELLANGNVWLLNANGIMFGKGSQVNVGALLATTADISDNDFRAGRYHFTKGSAHGSVVNQGIIQAASGGAVVLSAQSVSNEGLIRANLGKVVLGGATAFTVDMTGDNLLRYQIAPPTKGQQAATVSNSGTVVADGGEVMMTARAVRNVENNVINNTGIVEADSVSSKNGEIILDAGDGGTVNDSGTLNATGHAAGETGGTVAVTGNTVNVENGAKVDASGDRGGGAIEIGGGPHGAGALANAQTTNVGNAKLTADAVTSGNGGSVTVWSNRETRFSGTISAKGGAQGGNGGAVETSSHGHLNVGTYASVDTSAAKGSTGDWLLDPGDITIQNGGSDGLGCATSSCTIAPGTIISALGTTNVTLDATDTITVVNFGTYSSANSLSLLAENNIYVEDSIQNSGTGAINLIAGWNGTTMPPSSLTAAGVYGNNGGSIIVGGGSATGDVAVGSAGGTTTLAGADITLEAFSGNAQVGYSGAGGGDIDLFATGSLTLQSGEGGGEASQIGNGAAFGATPDFSGNVTGDISITVAGTTALESSSSAAWIGNLAGGGGMESGNVTLVTGDVTNSDSFGGADTLGAMLIADLGTTSAAGSGGNVTLGLTAPQTDYVNVYLDMGAIEYSSPHALTLLSTANFTLPYSIQNDGAGDLTILAGWNGTTLTDLLTTPGAYGNNTAQSYNDCENEATTCGAFVWVVSAPNSTLLDYNPSSSGNYAVGASGTGTSIGSKGGTTTVGAAQIYVEGLGGYAQIGYHASGGTGAINVIANGIPGTEGLTGIAACFDGQANICLIGGRQDFSNPNSNPTYAQIGDLGLGVAGTASSAINVTATGNISVAGGGIYSSTSGYTDPEIADAYALIGNGDATETAAQTVSGTISVDAGGQLNFASSAAAGSNAWLGNITGSSGLASGDVTIEMASVNSVGPVEFGAMIEADLGTTAEAGSGGNATVGFTGGDATVVTAMAGGFRYNSPNNLTVLSADNVNIASSLQNSGTGDITLVAGWNTAVAAADVLTTAGAYGNNSGSVSVGGTEVPGYVAVGSKGGTTTIAADDVVVEADNGFAQVGYNGAGGGAIAIDATGTVVVTANAFDAQIGNGGANVSGNVGGTISVNAGGDVLVSEAADSSGSSSSFAAIGNVSGDTTSSETGNISVTATGAVIVNTTGIEGLAYIGNFSPVATSGGATGDIAITAGAVVLEEADGAGEALIGDGGFNYNNIGEFTQGGATGGNIDINTGSLALIADTNSNAFGEARISNRGNGAVSGNISITTTGNIALSAQDGNLANIGNGESGSATVSGTTTIEAGGNLTITASGDGQARIGAGETPSSDIDVTVTGDITLLTSGTPDTIDDEPTGAAILIGNFANGSAAVGGNVSVTSTSGGISIAAQEDNSAIEIGNQSGTSTSGNVTLSASNASKGIVQIAADGADSIIEIGNSGSSGDASGDVSVAAGQDLDLSAAGNGAVAQIGNGGPLMAGDASGDITLTVGGNLMLASSTEGAFAQIGNGDPSQTGTGAASGNIAIDVAGTTSLDSAGGTAWVGNLADEGSVESGNVTLITGNQDSANPVLMNASLMADLGTSATPGSGGDVTIGFTNQSIALGAAVDYDSANALSLLSTGNVAIDANVLNGGSGALNIVAGWDGKTTSVTGLTASGVYGNNGGSIEIGGSGADGNVAIGTAAGTTTVAGDNVGLDATNGSAQIGYDGAGSGAIDVVASGNVTLTGGAQTGEFAQIGDGGYKTSGNDSGDITVTAAGNVTLDGGEGQEAYAQIGNGGAESNSGTEGYSETGSVDVVADTVALAAGSGTGSYTQIGDGGYEAGQSVDGGTVTVGGNLTVDAVSAVTLTGGGSAAYAQIGNGGDLLDANAANGTSGTISGDVEVLVSTPASNNAVTLKAGTGGASYSQIGNGGNDENMPAGGATVDFTVSGNITVDDLAMTGSNAGTNGYAQVGNGDASKQGTGNISGTITFPDGTNFALTNGTADGASAFIGNATGHGTVTGSIVGYGTTSPATPQTIGAIATVIQTPITPTDASNVVYTSVEPPSAPDQTSNIQTASNGPQPTPLDMLEGSGTGTGSLEGDEPPDQLTDMLGQSLSPSGGKLQTASKTLIPGLLTQVSLVEATRNPHGVPPAEEDYSSWGNEALWRW